MNVLSPERAIVLPGMFVEYSEIAAHYRNDEGDEDTAADDDDAGNHVSRPRGRYDVAVPNGREGHDRPPEGDEEILKHGGRLEELIFAVVDATANEERSEEEEWDDVQQIVDGVPPSYEDQLERLEVFHEADETEESKDAEEKDSL